MPRNPRGPVEQPEAARVVEEEVEEEPHEAAEVEHREAGVVSQGEEAAVEVSHGEVAEEDLVGVSADVFRTMSVLPYCLLTAFGETGAFFYRNLSFLFSNVFVI